jgi:hypothetical protein
MTMLRCPSAVVEKTLCALREAGKNRTECVVLWLSRRPVSPDHPIIEAFIPQQEVAIDYFRIPPAGMQALMTHLRMNKLALAAQVHSHPEEAFHSRADDTWAVTRHEGALSLVVPHFASQTTATNFVERIASFRLSAADKWVEIPPQHVGQYLEIV